MAAIPQVPEHTSLSGVTSQSAVSQLIPWVLIGFAGMFAVACALEWKIWTNDALRSIGIYLPLVSVLLILRIWRECNWEARGTWWGLLPLLYAVLMARAGVNALQIFVFTRHVSFSLLQSGLAVYAYGSGIVLLLGGFRIWKKAAFPLALLFFVNPVPSQFSQIDLPLQYFCAHAAHAFALAIGVQPEGNQLRLMFAPNFGMFIAPGCDGVRGAVTMGFLALILGYVYRFSIRMRSLAVLGAVALGYLFNLIRLCVLVLFYWVALRFPVLQPHGEGADYAIGGVLFLIAAALFAAVVRWNRRDTLEAEIPDKDTNPVAAPGQASHILWKGALIAVLAVLGSFSYLHGLVTATHGEAGTAALQSRIDTILPPQVGEYSLTRTWIEPDAQNRFTYRWGAYSSAKSSNEIQVAYWLSGGGHYPVGCHLARGDKPIWQRTQTFPTAHGETAVFHLDFYGRSGNPVLEASTLCDSAGCSEHVILPSHAGIALVGMGMTNFFFRPTSTPLPVLLREESNNLSLASEADANQMVGDIEAFISGMDTRALVRFAESGGE